MKTIPAFSTSPSRPVTPCVTALARKNHGKYELVTTSRLFTPVLPPPSTRLRPSMTKYRNLMPSNLFSYFRLPLLAGP
jgi:hypothetical protein